METFGCGIQANPTPTIRVTHYTIILMYTSPQLLVIFSLLHVLNAKVDDYFELFPELEQLRDSVVGSDNFKREAFDRLYESALNIFDLQGYKSLLNQITNGNSAAAFTESLSSPNFGSPHCDKDGRKYIIKGNPAKFPGGPTNTPSYNLVKWIGNLLSQSKTTKSAESISPAVMALQGFSMVKGAVQTGVAVITDIVPPMIPPPFWINAPLPCLPMVTGMNCLGSVLYPISASDFVMADISDSAMEGIIASFPGKYLAKVGRTSDLQYKLCASAYLGMHCASIFPLCWIPPGISNASTFPLCYVQCLATLVACPGFWLDDIMGPCSDVAIPPFCSFSVFVNHSRVPPQYSSFDDSHPYPPDCPQYDPKMDLPKDIDDVQHFSDSPIDKEYKKFHVAKGHLKWTPYKNCDCQKLQNVCHTVLPYPVFKKYTNEFAETHYESPSQNPIYSRCCRICKKIARVYHRNTINT
ncbi:conserved Plasmodium protein, unknown function [Babesia microti strain RI]|uniref:Uncharacterized protein n=1 Tax=Babesia microti (strain RI) TaxID=1133968 RepID=A0A1R4AA12_BABMR|nr:conserved Plasmodium protein, unknown function [Babesia microti strain RI]SJK85833.1 conserved Plasmodium protein, unknown function [Babesia microti strain RI]|eukprot:XP_012647918.2 conserved Plasmodium protein, unknown function [Babesia microti strain RI]